MPTDRRITPQELPKLIAAAVEKALSQRPLTQEQLANLSKTPIRCGIFPVDPVLKTEEAAAPAAGAAPPIVLHRPFPFGFILRDFDQLIDPVQVRPFINAEGEKNAG